MNASVSISRETAVALSSLGLGEVQQVEPAERMAWIVRVMRVLPDKPEWFPKGKWATIQHIEEQITDAAGVEGCLIACAWHRSQKAKVCGGELAPPGK